jgi:hypothetical protein
MPTSAFPNTDYGAGMGKARIEAAAAPPLHRFERSYFERKDSVSPLAPGGRSGTALRIKWRYRDLTFRGQENPRIHFLPDNHSDAGY